MPDATKSRSAMFALLLSMTSNQVGSNYLVAGYGWGFGMRIQIDAGPNGNGSFGWNGGTGTQFEVDPRSGAIAIVFAPTWPGTPGVGICVMSS